MSFVIKLGDKTLYLLCSDTTAVLKEQNIHQYYQTPLSSKYSQLTGKQQSKKLKKFKTEYIIRVSSQT